MIADLIVLGSLVLAAAFVAAWALSPRLRRRIERPKHRFLEDVREYDRGDRGRGRTPGDDNA
jgi:hypothetical protein